jgi:glucosamine-6-phosphate deaminase
MKAESAIERHALEVSGRELRYAPEEKLGIVTVDNFPMLGTLTALRFLEWVHYHPDGVISLPTGKTPEYFIKEVRRFLENWESLEVQRELQEWGFPSSEKPEMGGLHFVQIDEFYPINSHHTNSFHYYVEKFYIEGFGLDPEKALLIKADQIGLPEGRTIEELWGEQEVDLTLRYRSPLGRLEQEQKEVIERIDQWCMEYEQRIRELGGIGFFLGGIGPDGHVAFNVRGSDMYSTTRLTNVNYETQAASASDLGGIEVARKRRVITIGLATITYNPECTAIIIAAGEAKAKVVANAVHRQQDVHYPATVLHDLQKARFFLTAGAAKELTARSLLRFREREQLQEEDIEKVVVDLSLKTGKRLKDLKREDYLQDRFGSELLAKQGDSVEELNRRVEETLKRKIEEGMKNRRHTRFLHTEPHHDDVMLGYLPYVVRNIREHSNYHHFATFTSGFTSVTNHYMLTLYRQLKETLRREKAWYRELVENGYFDLQEHRYWDRDVWKYLDGLAAQSEEQQQEGVMRRLIRDLMILFEEEDLDNLEDRVDELINYFSTQYPGKKDLDYIQTLKGMCREWESACLWGYFGWNSESIEHLRLGFYKGTIFTEEPTFRRDVLPVVDLLRRTCPDVLSVALDPEASGPDTHYKVLQAVSQALQQYREEKEQEIEILGYRNVWYRFHPSEANIFVPVSLNMLTLQHSSFMNTYISQKDASFPSYEYDGPFSLLAQKIQTEQYEMLKTCLGREFFYDHSSALIRATRGFVFLKSMDEDAFLERSFELRRKAENR